MKNLPVLGILAATFAASCKGGPTDWKDAPIKTMEGKIKDVAFTIDLPTGMDGLDQGDFGYEFNYKQDGRVGTPSITVMLSEEVATLEAAIKSEGSETTVFDQETTATGWSYAYENSAYKGKEDYIVNTTLTIAGKNVSCSGRITPFKRGGTSKDRIPLIKKYCASIKLK
jgi:hypothetical protein